jgi:hypothetical protein
LIANRRFIDARQELPLLHNLAGVGERLDDRASQLGAHLGLARRLERARQQRSHAQHRLLDNGDVLDADVDDRRAVLFSARFVVASTARHPQHREAEQESSVSDGAQGTHGANAPV